jgi:hypothetical protein
VAEGGVEPLAGRGTAVATKALRPVRYARFNAALLLPDDAPPITRTSRPLRPGLAWTRPIALTMPLDSSRDDRFNLVQW